MQVYIITNSVERQQLLCNKYMKFHHVAHGRGACPEKINSLTSLGFRALRLEWDGSVCTGDWGTPCPSSDNGCLQVRNTAATCAHNTLRHRISFNTADFFIFFCGQRLRINNLGLQQPHQNVPVSRMQEETPQRETTLSFYLKCGLTQGNRMFMFVDIKKRFHNKKVSHKRCGMFFFVS